MLGLAPLAAAPLSDNGGRLPRITAGAIGDVALGGTAEGEARTAAVSPVAMLPVGGELAGVGRIDAYGAADLPAAGNGVAIGQLVGEASGRFATSTTAVVALLSAASSYGNIEFSAQRAGRVESAGAASRLWDLAGVSAARSSLIASGAGLLGPTGAARGAVTTQSSVAGAIAVARWCEAESAIAGAAVPGLALEGNGQGGAQSVGASNGCLGLDAVAQAQMAHAVTLANGLRLTGSATAGAISSARAEALGPGLAGRAFGTTLEARFAKAFGQLGFGVNAQGEMGTQAAARIQAQVGIDASGRTTTSGTINGDLRFARDLDADVLDGGQAARQIEFGGMARAVTFAAADTPAGELKIKGRSEARSGNLATMRHELSVSGHAELASPILVAAIPTFAWAGASGAITGTRAVVGAETSLQGESLSGTSIYAEATDDLTTLANGAGHVSPVAQLRSDLAMAGASMGTISSFGLGRGVFDVARDFDGDVAVFGDSARAIGLAGKATVNSAAIGTVTTVGLVLTGSAAATSIGQSKAATQVSLSDEANGQVQSEAFVQHRLKIDLVAEGVSPQTAESNGTWATEGHVDGTLALMGSAGGGLAIASGASARGTLVARTSGVVALKGAITTALETRADAAGVLAIGRDSDAAVGVDGDAHRSINLHGSCEGQANITAKPRPLHLIVTLTTDAANSAHGRASSEVTTAGSGLVQVQSRAASQGRLPVSRTGAADVLILGAAWRGMPFLGISQALIPAVAAANSSVMPGLAAAAANVIHVDLKAAAIAPGGQAAGSNLACAQDVRARWDLDMAAIAFRAPPALGRSELPRMGLSGRLVPSNTGHILKG